jgi:hypothetical protein
MTPRLTLSALTAAIALLLAPSAFAQAKSNIQDDPKSSNCTENCVDAGYEWAIANTPASEADCAASNSDFAEGCAHWLTEQSEEAAAPSEEPGATAMDDSAAPMPDDSAAPPPDDSAAPAPEEGAQASDADSQQNN